MGRNGSRGEVGRGDEGVVGEAERGTVERERRGCVCGGGRKVKGGVVVMEGERR